MQNFSINNEQKKIFTWHIHGSYLFYLSQTDCIIYIPVTAEKKEGYYGRGETFPFGKNVIEIAAEEVKNTEFDCILFQSEKNYLTDQYEILSEAQRKLPRIYLEHNTPGVTATDDLHVVDEDEVMLVHVTHYNQLMWHNRTNAVRVIDHGIMPQSFPYTGELEKGLVIINHMHQRGRKLGGDIYDLISRHIPLDLIGMGTEKYGGLGEILHPDLPAFRSRYRFLFNPIRHTSLALSVLEAMMSGMPVAAVATTEYVTVIKDGINGYINTNMQTLITQMSGLLEDQSLAKRLGEEAKKTAETRFNIQRFVTDWEKLFAMVINDQL